MNIIVPMNNKPTAIHTGHKAIIDYAKTFGTPVVFIYKTFHRYDIKDNKFKEQVKSIKELGVDVYILPELKIPPDKLSEAKHKAKIIVEQYKENLILDRYIQQATNYITSLLIKKYIQHKYNINSIVYGPEVFHFFIKSISKIARLQKCYIFKNMLKSEELGIRHQTMTCKISKEAKQQLPKIKNIIDEYKPYFNKGENWKLVKDLNNAYKNKLWSIQDITVFEEKMIEGKIEVIGILFPTPNTEGGSVLIEEVNYYA